MFGYQQEPYNQPMNINSETRTPRSIVQPRSTNKRQELSPFVAGARKNNEQLINPNPNYENKIFNEQPNQKVDVFNQPIQQQPYNQEAPKTPIKKSGPRSVVSNSSSNSQAVDLVCTNCINKHLMMQKQDRDRMEKETDQLLRQITESNYRNSLQKEMEKQKQIKDQYKNDANVQLEQINNKKIREENLKRSMNNDQNNQALTNSDYERYQRLHDMQNDLKSDLLKQITDKEIEKRNDKFNRDNYKTTLDIGDSYRPKSAFAKNYGEDLREQMIWKENQKQMERDVK